MQYFGVFGTEGFPDMGDMSMEDMAKMGVAMGVMGNVIGANSDVFAPITQGQQISMYPGQPAEWSCTCGASGLTGKYCINCGTKRPEPMGAWNCTCGSMGLTSLFCPNCGKARG